MPASGAAPGNASPGRSILVLARQIFPVDEAAARAEGGMRFTFLP